MSAEETNQNQYLHEFLDLAGTIPIIGDICDIANVALYAKEGNWKQVALYVGCAVGADLAIKGVKFGCKLLKKYGKNVISDIAKKVGIKSAKETAEELAEHIGIQVAESYEEAAERSVREMAENNGEHAAKDTAEKVAKDQARDATTDLSKKEVVKCCDGIQCFTAGTLVLTADGYKAIEEIESGDYVYSEDPETGEKGLKQVVQTFENEKNELVEVYIDDQRIETTTGHPFWIEDKGWTKAEDLQEGDVVRLQSGSAATVDRIEIVVPEESIKVYNFEVEDWHTYYVSERGVLVHNKCGGQGATKTKSAKRLAAEAKLEKAAKGDIGPTIDRATGYEVGTIYVDANGNAMISPKGGTINPNGTGYRGMDTETLYPNGSVYQRNNPNGHASMPGQNHGHGHLLGTGHGKGGAGPSIDINGNVVPRNSPAAHWPTK